jgi:GNAT superfamily N-acetyltransferase
LPSTLTFRAAVRSDHDALEALQRRASLEWPDYREPLLAHPDAIELPLAQIDDGNVIVAVRDGDIVGFAVVLPRDDGAAELDGLFVEPASWRGGIGRALIGEATALAVGYGATELHVIANPRAVGFYRACSFAERSTASTRFGPAITMVRPIPG